MSRNPIRFWTVALGVTAIVGVVAVSQRSLASAQAARPGNHEGHVLSATEQIEQLAAAGDIHANHALDELRWALAQSQAAPANPELPADDMGVAARLARSRGRFVTITVDGTPMRTWVVLPEGTGPAPVVVVIQEIFGLSDWIRGVADQLAREGFIAVAPDLLAGHGPRGGDTASFGSQQEIMKAVLSLQHPEIMARLKAARDWGLDQPRSNGRVGSIGFCYGGGQSFAFAVEDPTLDAAVVYYGDAPTDAPPAPRGRGAGGRGAAPPPFVPSDSLAQIQAPILGLYGGLMQDQRIGRTVAPTEAKMKELGKIYEPHVFDGASHGFLRAQTGNDGANMKATEQAWPMTLAWLNEYLH